ncbi:ABC transporter permease [Bdellovibrio sp. 22V]|uniref:MlaE family ABC transporter permease n=1 Tax=Bdellovibrio TaxID=958 RepID=UPI002543410B|nr:ABC transporter permease [Bdellovibrio sp. 22V]WII72737.1 ABC transporter permease [Bdellovibrio sp. 22V]
MTFVISILDEVGGTLLFLRNILRTLFQKKLKTHEVFEQIWKVTADSFFTTAMAGFFVGAIMTVQFAMQMKEFGALGYLGGLATSGTFREVGPLLIAFMLSGKVGAFTSAELGTMRVTEQIDAVRCLGADPMQEIIVPRFIGIIISSFFLLGGGLIMSVFGGMLMGQAFAGVNFEEYLRHVPTIVSPVSVLSGLVKCFFFSLVLATVCTFRGYTTTGGAKGVGRSVVATAVTTMVCIVVMDWLTSFLGEIILQMIRGYRS